jgi:glyoxylase-like metal-dependent hydrolase (beta-lactamase superfamily II)
LHFDHFNGVAAFERIALVDTERTRAATLDGRFTPGRYEFLGLFDGLQAPSVQVSEWIEAGADFDLGGRALSVISTPGHTAESISLFDAEAKRLFTGDFIYPTMLYAFLPGANLTDYRRTTQRLLNTLPEDTILWGGHCCRRDTGYAAPWLTMQDLRDLDTALEQQANGQLRGDEFFPRRYQVNEQMILGTAFPWNNH